MAGVSTCKQRKMVCDVCDWSFYATRGPAAERLAEWGSMPSCFCGSSMRFADLEDAGRVALAADRFDTLDSHPDYVEERMREMRRVLRENQKGKAGVKWQCKCGTFIAAPNSQCQCGFKNDIRGHRNHGRYVEGAAWCRNGPEMPF